ETITCLELCQRAYPALDASVGALIEEGNQISRMTQSLMRRLRPSHYGRGVDTPTHHSKLTTQNFKGFTLIESLLALTISLLLLAAALSIMSQMERVFAGETEGSDVQQRLRVGVDALTS